MEGKVLTVRGPVEPRELGRVMMHEHLHCDIYDWKKQEVITEEKPITAERRDFLMKEAVPYLKKCTDYGCHAFVETTPAPWRAWPTFYVEASKTAGIHIILCTGYYREVEKGTYWVKSPADAIWPFVRTAPVEELAEFCVREILEGIHGTNVRAGAIKLGSSGPELTEAEEKAFRAGARAQKTTGVHITTHCHRIGSEKNQLAILDDEGIDLGRVVIGHTAPHLMDPTCRKSCIEWMKRGVNFLPTNLDCGKNGSEAWRPLVEAIHEVFDAGLGNKLTLGLDWAFVSESGPFGPCSFISPPPFLHMFTHTLPALRGMGLTETEEEAIMRGNPQSILPVKK